MNSSFLKQFLASNIIILVLVNSTNVFNYLFQMVLGRSLTLAEYGHFNSLNSLSVLLSTPTMILMMTFSRYTVQLEKEGIGEVKSLIVFGLKIALVIAGLILVVGLFCLPALQKFLQIEDRTSIVLMLVMLAVFSLFTPITLGVLQGLRRYFHLGLSSALLSGARLGFGVLFVVVFGWGVNGALLGGIAGSAVAILVSFWFLRVYIFHKRVEPRPQLIQLGEMSRYSLPVFLTDAMILALGNLDLILVRHFNTPEESGLYATAAVLGRIAFYLPSVLFLVLFPEAAKAKRDGECSRKHLWLSLAITVALSGSVALLFWLFPTFFITILFGEAHTQAAPLLVTVSSAMAMLSIGYMLFMYHLARHEFGYLWGLSTSLATLLILVYFFHDTPQAIANNLLIASGVAMVSAIFISLVWYRKGANGVSVPTSVPTDTQSSN